MLRVWRQSVGDRPVPWLLGSVLGGMVSDGQAGPDGTVTQNTFEAHHQASTAGMRARGGPFPTARLGSEVEITHWRRETGWTGRLCQHTLASHCTGTPFLLEEQKRPVFICSPFWQTTMLSSVLSG